MQHTMKSMMLTGIRQMEMREVPVPEIERDTDVLIRMKRLWCMRKWYPLLYTGRIGSQIVRYPFPVGHEGAGIVEIELGLAFTRGKTGPNCIAVEPAMPCGHCDQCIAGRPHTCRNLTISGLPRPGAAGFWPWFYCVMPEDRAVSPLQEISPVDHASLSEPWPYGCMP